MRNTYSSSVIWQGVPDDIANKGENCLMKHLGHDDGDWKFEKHRSEWITEADIAELAQFGLNTVRVPIGYWIAGEDKTGGSEWKTYAPNAVSHLDTLIKDWAVKYNIAVLVGIHAAKGSQNGNDHSAPTDIYKQYWSQYPENVQNTIDLAVWIADRYRNDISFLGVGLLNEPGGDTNKDILLEYYSRAHDAIRATGNDCVLTHSPMINEQGPDHDANMYPSPRYSNMWHEWHKYILWSYEQYSEDQLMWGAINDISQQIKDWQGNWLFLGEWSVATGPNAPFNDDAKFKQLLTRMTQALNQCHSGWTAWTWKVSYDETGRNPWSLRTLLRKGLFTFGNESEQSQIQE